VPAALNPIEVRVLGCLIEKDLATPEYYPLSLNALVNACNQKSNRDPVASYDDAETRQTLESLRELHLAVFVSEAGSRVEKYRHRLSETLNLSRGELAILAVLLLRGPQTAGELKTRTDRMYPFDDLDVVESTLSKLASHRGGPLAVLLPRQAGQKEPRWAHLLSGEPQIAVAEPDRAPPAPRADRLAQLEAEVASLKQELEQLRTTFEEFRRQF
jgi:uncharacterized protein